MLKQLKITTYYICITPAISYSIDKYNYSNITNQTYNETINDIVKREKEYLIIILLSFILSLVLILTYVDCKQLGNI